MANLSNSIGQDLLEVRTQFLKNGYDIRLVGGCVRDLLNNSSPSDIDLCTDANPKQQIDLYKKLGIRYIETGLQHGTVTIVLDNATYEITSLRQDIETDGRHAKVNYIKDWYIDLERRDFTINSMSMTFDGDLIDPFNGQRDLASGVVRFVGNAEQRVKEDYLRILRWFRFRARYGHEIVDADSYNAIVANKHGLEAISRERIWSEFRKILSGPNNVEMLNSIHEMGINEFCDLPYEPNDIEYVGQVAQLTNNPVTLLVAAYQLLAIETLKNWKASKAEIDLCTWLAKALFSERHPLQKLMVVNGIQREYAVELAALRCVDPFDMAIIKTFEIPKFPITGNDLIAAGVKPGVLMGMSLDYLKTVWFDSNYTKTKDDLLSLVR